MKQFSLSTEEKTQVIETGKLIIRGILLSSIKTKRLRIDEHHAAEVEVIAQTACLVVYHRMWLSHPVFHGIMVTVHHHGIGIVCHPKHPFQGLHTDSDRSTFRTEQRIVCRSMFRHESHRLRTSDTYRNQRRTVIRRRWCSFLLCKEINMLYGLAFP